MDAYEQTLSVKFHKTKLSVRDPNGETKEETQDADFEWIVTVIEPDRLSAYAAHDENKTRFGLNRR